MKKLLLIVIILIVLSYGIYRMALSYAADQIVQQISEEVLTDEVIIQLKSDPQIQDLLKKYEKKDTSDIHLTQKNMDNLPFTTKEEAVKTIIGKFSIGEIHDVTVKASRGLTLKEQAELETMVMQRLTSEEIEALLIIGIAEISEELLN